ncbi:MAG: sigma-70 family RNA polymerase sigma factor [Planctomycetota bacterium]|nr:sigma-70 family RNA polymerase sigma factor [Planctomycetota bacterium]
MSEQRDRAPNAGAAGGFQSTHWSLVLRAGHREDREAALAALCERYWYPLYAYVRRRVVDVNEAQDLTQEFFAWLLEKNALVHASRERGRFRSFLLTAVKNFLANQWDRTKARKRGGGIQRLSLDLDCGESRLHLEPSHDLTPERLFERQWVMTLLDLVMRRLLNEYESSGKADQFERLKGAMTGDRDRLPYAAVAAELGMSEEAARQAASRLRKRYRELLREEVAQTLAEPGDVDDEIRSFFEVLGG